MDSQTAYDTNITAFIDQLLTDQGVDKSDAEVYEQLRADLSEQLEDRINATIVANMPENRLDDFMELMNNADDATVQEFCLAQIPNLAGLIAGEMVAFRNRFLAA